MKVRYNFTPNRCQYSAIALKIAAFECRLTTVYPVILN